MAYDSALEYVTRKDEMGNALPVEGRRKIFVSYRKKDNLYGIRDRVAEYILAALDCAVWYDVSLTPGNDYDQEIARALQESDVIVLLLTPHILQSSYVWDIEIKQALQQKKGIIPVSLGISVKDLPLVEERLGHMQLLSGDCLMTERCSVEAKNVFVEDLSRALNQFVISQDIALSVTRFFAARKDLLPTRVLSFEQMYLMAYGFLKGLGTELCIEDAVAIMDSLLYVYARDVDTRELKGEIAYHLMLYYTQVEDATRVLEYGEKADRCGNTAALFHLGNLYRKGHVLEKSEKQALEHFVKGAAAHHLDSIRMTAKMLLGSVYLSPINGKTCSGSYEQALPYFVDAAERGSLEDLQALVATLWNVGHRKEERIKACQYLLGPCGEPYPSSSGIEAFLRRNLERPSYLTTYPVRPYKRIEESERLGQIQIHGTSFYLYREKVAERQNNMIVMRGDTKIYEFGCAAYGFGDMDFFDLKITEQGDLMVHSAEFDHYGRETILQENYIMNPFSDVIMVFHSADGEWLPGVRKLAYPAYV